MEPDTGNEGSLIAKLRTSKLLNGNADGLVLVFVLFLFVALASFGLSDSHYGRVERGPVLRLSGDVYGSAVVDDGIGRTGSFSLTTVQVRTLNWGEVILETIRGRSVAPLDTTVSPRVAAQMDASKHLAAAVALDVTGYVYDSPPGAYVAAVLAGSPAAAAGLLPGSLILAVDGEPIADPAALGAAISGSARVVLTVALTATDPTTIDDVVITVVDDRIGIEVLPAGAAALSRAVDVATDGVGGPSAGLMMTLAFLDALSPGDLTAGLDVAGTGTIRAARTVGEVSGAELKAAAAVDMGMDVFFAPSAHVVEVRSAVKDRITVVPVNELADAVEYLCAKGASDDLCAPPR